MTPNKPEWLGPNNNAPQKLSEVSQTAANAVEGELREFVRRDVAFLHTHNQREPATEPNSNYLNSLIRRVSGASMEEIDHVILELQGVRAMLQNEGERVSREVSGYASLTHAAMTAMKVIGESLRQWKDAPEAVDQNRSSAN
jgi:hypothetical protein